MRRRVDNSGGFERDRSVRYRNRGICAHFSDIPDDAPLARPLDRPLSQHVGVVPTSALLIGKNLHDVPVDRPGAVHNPGIPILPWAISGIRARIVSSSGESNFHTPITAHIPAPSRQSCDVVVTPVTSQSPRRLPAVRLRKGVNSARLRNCTSTTTGLINDDAVQFTDGPQGDWGASTSVTPSVAP